MTELENQIRSLLEPKELKSIVADPSSCQAHIDRARQHLNAAEMAANLDPAAAVQLAYDAARKALNAILSLVGLKVHERAGSHGSYIRLSKLTYLDQEIWIGLEELKKLRNRAEYDEYPIEISSSFALQIIKESRLMVADVQGLVERFIQTTQAES